MAKRRSPKPEGEKVERTVRFASGLVLGGGLFAEEVYTQDGPKFILYSAEPESYPTEVCIDRGFERVLPIRVDPKLLGALTLPEGVVRYGSIQGVLLEMEKLALEVFDPVDELPLFRLVLRLAVASWFIGLLYPQAGRERYAPIIQTIGLPENGKGRFLTVCRQFFYRSFYLQKTVRVPSIFRAIEPWDGTLILDEADLDRSSEASELIEFLNGRSYGNPNVRYSAESDKNRTFLSFGYTILATRNPYWDAGFNSRAIIFRSQAAADANRIPLVPTAEWYERAMALRCQLLLFRLRIWAQIRAKKIVPLSNFRIEGLSGRFRVRAAFLPLAALEPVAPELLADCKNLAREIHRRQVAERAESIEGQLLGQVYEHLQGETDWSLRERNGTWRFERLVASAGSEEPDGNEPLTLSELCAPFGDRPPRKSLSNAWKNFGQKFATRERYGGRLHRSVVVIADPARLCREFGLYVPEALPMFDRFGLAPIDAPTELPVTEPIGVPTEVQDSVPLVPHVPLAGTRRPVPLHVGGGSPLRLDSPLTDIGANTEIDRAVRSLGPTILYPDGTVADRRTGAIISRPEGVPGGGTSGTGGTNALSGGVARKSESTETDLRWEDDGGRPGGAR